VVDVGGAADDAVLQLPQVAELILTDVGSGGAGVLELVAESLELGATVVALASSRLHLLAEPLDLLAGLVTIGSRVPKIGAGVVEVRTERSNLGLELCHAIVLSFAVFLLGLRHRTAIL